MYRFYAFCFVFQVAACALAVSIGAYGTAVWAAAFAAFAIWAAKNS